MPTYKNLKIVFFGTPDFAVASLQALVEEGVKVVAVVTAPDKPAGRGMQLKGSPVKQYAVEQGLPLLQPEKLKNLEFIEELRACRADLHIVVAFRMLPEVVWNMPPLGTVNVHASLLPQYRGAAPINWAIINGETETGVTTFRLKHEIDTGDILLQEHIAINPEDNVGTLYKKLMKAGAELLVKTVRGLAEGFISEKPQSTPGADLKHAPKIFKEHTLIDWNKNIVEIHNLIRGLSPYPGAYTTIMDKTFKIYQSHYQQDSIGVPYGTVDSDHKQFLRIAAKDGWLYIDELQQEGKRRMDIESFLRGFRG